MNNLFKKVDGGNGKVNGKAKSKGHPSKNWAKNPKDLPKWFDGSSEYVKNNWKKWSGTVEVTVNGDTFEIPFVDFPFDVVAEAKERNGYLSKYMRRLIGAYLAPGLANVEAQMRNDGADDDEINEWRKEFSESLADALGIKNRFALTGEAHYNTGQWLNAAAEALKGITHA